ncbi:MAG: MarR family transcriptional regulator [Acidobacteria bacterium]|nr:MarR family transcriptional regulator [Acidobacteriota bacterium]
MAKVNPKNDKKKRFRPTSRGIAYVALLRAADRVKSYFEILVAPFDITGQQYNVLRILRGAEPEGLPTLTIAERMIERAPGITRMIDRLEAKELVRRESCPEDRRCVYCRITAKGLNLLELLDEPVDETNAVFDGLSKAELKQFTALLEKVQKALESKSGGINRNTGNSEEAN